MAGERGRKQWWRSRFPRESAAACSPSLPLFSNSICVDALFFKAGVLLLSTDCCAGCLSCNLLHDALVLWLHVRWGHITRTAHTYLGSRPQTLERKHTCTHAHTHLYKAHTRARAHPIAC